MDDNSLVINKIQDIQQLEDERETDSGTYEKSPLKKLTALEVKKLAGHAWPGPEEQYVEGASGSVTDVGVIWRLYELFDDAFFSSKNIKYSTSHT